MTSEEHLGTLLQTALVKHTERKDAIRRIAWTLKIATMSLGVIATLMLGLTIAQDSRYFLYARNGALICTALSTFLSGLAAMWNIDEYWLRRKVIVTRLESLVEEFEFERAGTNRLPESQVKQFFRRYQRVVSQKSEYWEARASKKPSEGDLQHPPEINPK